MRSSSLGLLAVALLTGCEKTKVEARVDASASASASAASASADASDAKAADAKPLDFTIDTVFEKQKPLDHPPWHEDGGVWTFFDVHLTKSNAKLGLGFEALDAAFTHALVTTPSFDESKKIIDAARAQLQTTARLEELAPAATIRFTPFGDTRNDEGRHAIYVKVGRGTIDLHVRFDVKAKRGSLEPDPQRDREWSLRVLSAYLHGPRPERTEANDPQISGDGPKLGNWRTFAPAGSRFLGFFPDPKHVLYDVPTGALTSISVDDEKSTELVSKTGTIDEAQCSAEVCVVNSFVEFGGPAVLAVTFRATKTRRVLQAPPSDSAIRFARKAIAPGGAHFAIAMYKKLWFVPTNGGDAKLVEYRTACDVVGWTGGRAIVAYVSPEERKPLFDLVSPTTGERQPIADPPVFIRASPSPIYWPRDGISPDRKQRYDCSRVEITLTEVASHEERHFPIHVDDRVERDQSCELPWWNARYLGFETSKHGVIDTKTMKLSYLAPPGTDIGDVNDDFTYAVRKTSDGLELGRIIRAR